MSKCEYDVIVVGAGHAGAEAAAAAARIGARTLLITDNLDTVGAMSCNPAIGGIGKGHIVREIEALGGVMGRAADAAAIQARILNRRKGPAVRATRIQADRPTYARAVRSTLDQIEGLLLLQERVDRLVIEQGRCSGVETRCGRKLYARSVVVTAGTFLAGKIHVGRAQFGAGRAGDPPAFALAEFLRELDLGVGRLKTGTPPRIDRRSVDLQALPQQVGDHPRPRFAPFAPAPQELAESPCFVTQTNESCHTLIRDSLHDSPIYSGAIDSVGPRYCPSIEDKVVRFADRDHHQILLEPEGLASMELYPNGLSTGLPFAIQEAVVRTLVGLEEAQITRPGYAIEYDYLDPRRLRPWLESDTLDGLFLAGQINGTTGYEEAAGQGLIAGLNAARSAWGQEPWVPQRSEAYIGVMIDDLVSTGVTEPYRMFTSRAENRLRLRDDNAEARLLEQGRALGLVSEPLWERFRRHQEAVSRERKRLKQKRIHPGSLSREGEARLRGPLRRDQSLYELLRRPELSYADVVTMGGEQREAIDAEVCPERVGLTLEIEAHYDGYVAREDQENQRHARYEAVVIPAECDYSAITGLSTEVRDKLQRSRPTSVGEAARLPEITPAAISLLLVHLRRRGWLRLPRRSDESTP